MIPRPLGSAIHSTKPNQVLHFDYLHVGEGSSKFKYVHVLRDDLSSFVDLFPSESANTEAVVLALFDWFTRNGVVPIWISDHAHPAGLTADRHDVGAGIVLPPPRPAHLSALLSRARAGGVDQHRSRSQHDRLARQLSDEYLPV